MHIGWESNSRAAVSAAGFPDQRQTGLGQLELVLRARTHKNGAGIREEENRGEEMETDREGAGGEGEEGEQECRMPNMT